MRSTKEGGWKAFEMLCYSVGGCKSIAGLSAQQQPVMDFRRLDLQIVRCFGLVTRGSLSVIQCHNSNPGGSVRCRFLLLLIGFRMHARCALCRRHFGVAVGNYGSCR